MPQFDFYSFCEQVLLVVFIFYIFYMLFLRFYLLTFAKAIKMRLKVKNFLDIKQFNSTIKKRLNTSFFIE